MENTIITKLQKEVKKEILSKPIAIYTGEDIDMRKKFNEEFY